MLVITPGFVNYGKTPGSCATSHPPPKGGVLSSSHAPEKALQLHMPANQRPATASFALGRFDTNTLEDRIMNLLATADRCRKTWAKASALVASGLLIATCLGVSAFSVQVSQSHKSNADLQPFVGTWQAKFKGTIFQTVKLAVKEDNVTGTISHA